MSTLDAVLSRIDQDIDQSVERLFALLRIESISTDPAFKGSAAPPPSMSPPTCAASVLRPKCGRPRVIPSWSANPNGISGPRVLFYGHYDVQPVDPLEPVEDAAVRAAHRDASRRAQDHRRAWRLRRQRPGHDLCRGLPRLSRGHRQAAAADHHHDRGRGGVRLAQSIQVRAGQCKGVHARPGAGLRYRHVGPGDAGDHHLAARPGL